MAVKKIIKFSSDTCMPCQRFKPIFEKVSTMEKYKDITFEQYDIEDDEAQDMLVDFMVRSIPNTIFLDDNNEPVRKITGAISEEDFTRILDSVI